MVHRRLVIRERITAIVGSAILFALVALSYWYSIQTEMAGLRYVPSEMSPDFMASNVALTQFETDGIPKMKVFAERMQHFSDERMRAEKAELISLRPDAAPAAAQADEAWSNDGLETVELSGNVFFRRSPYKDDPEMTFSSEYLKGWLDTQRFQTDKPVLLTRGLDTSRSEEGLVYDNVSRTAVLTGSVESVFHTQNFRAAGAEADSAQTARP